MYEYHDPCRLPLDRFLPHDWRHDVCGAVNYLVSDEASFVTGVVIPVDGGFLAYSGV